MIRRVALAVATMMMADTARADPRISTQAYQPTSIVVVRGKPGIESTVAFAEDERIENVAVGNSAAWQVTPNKRGNLLFLKPASVRAHTNMTVITDQRTYLFDLVSVAGATPVYMMRFTYPEKRAPMTLAAATPAIQPAVAEAAPFALAQGSPADALKAAASSPADLNFAWVTAGDRGLLPQRTFDDGQATFLAWPKSATLPAILMRGPAGDEGPVNFTVRGEYIVVDGVPPQIVLRAGKAMATLTPAISPAPAAKPPAEAPAAIALADTGTLRP